MGFNSFTGSLGISTSLSKPHLINCHEMLLFIENIGEEAENNAKQKYKMTVFYTGSNNCGVESVPVLWDFFLFFVNVN